MRKKLFSLELPTELIEKIRCEAKAQEETMSSLIRNILIAYFNELEKQRTTKN